MKSSRQQLRVLIITATMLLASISSGFSQEYYQDYGDDNEDRYHTSSRNSNRYQQQDNLYADYAMRQQDKAVKGSSGNGFGKIILFGSAGWVGGAVYQAHKAQKTLQKKQLIEAKKLYSQYYNDVYKLQEQNADLMVVLSKIEATWKKAHAKREREEGSQVAQMR